MNCVGVGSGAGAGSGGICILPICVCSTKRHNIAIVDYYHNRLVCLAPSIGLVEEVDTCHCTKQTTLFTDSQLASQSSERISHEHHHSMMVDLLTKNGNNQHIDAC